MHVLGILRQLIKEVEASHDYRHRKSFALASHRTLKRLIAEYEGHAGQPGFHWSNTRVNNHLPGKEYSPGSLCSVDQAGRAASPHAMHPPRSKPRPGAQPE
jgi:hypothetical protein